MDEDNKIPAGEPSGEAGTSDDEYAFMTETVRKRPHRGRKIGLSLLAVLVGGALFGVTSGLIFRAMNPDAAEYITFDQDDETGEDAGGDEAAPDGTADGGEEAGNDPAPETEPTPEATPEVTPEVTPEPTPELTPEERQAARITDYEELYSAMSGIAEEAETSLVTVQGIASTEDWFETVSVSRKSSSGLIIADTHDALLILTDQSVTEDIERLLVMFADGSTADAQVLRSDPRTGLTVVTVPTASVSPEMLGTLTVADLGNSYSVRRGQPLIALGRPVGVDGGIGFGEVTSLSDSVSATDSRFILVTTDIYGSADGSGFLIDLDGKYVGVIKAAYSPEGSQTVAAIAISPIKTTIEKLSNNEAIGYLGIHGDDVTQVISDETGIPVGMYVSSVEPDSPSAAAGVQAGDVVTAIDDDAVTGVEAYQRLLMAKAPEDITRLTVERLGAEGYVPLDFEMTVGGI